MNVKDNEGKTPLIYVAWKGHKEINKLLIAQSADISAKDELDGHLCIARY